MSPTMPRRSSSAATARESRSSPLHWASSEHCSRLKDEPSSVASTVSSAVRTSGEARRQTSLQRNFPRFANRPCIGLSKEIALGRTYQVARAPHASSVLESAYDARRPARQLATSQTRHGGKFVGRRFQADAQNVAVRVSTLAIISKRVHSCQTDRHFDQAFAPRTSECVGNDHRYRKSELFLKRPVNTAGRGISIAGQERGRLPTLDGR